jgi:hypothetical protein
VINTSTLTKDQLYTSLFSRVCPACGDRKGEEKSMCYDCFKKLPAAIKSDLYKRFGQGYEGAMSRALVALKAERFHEAQETNE